MCVDIQTANIMLKICAKIAIINMEEPKDHGFASMISSTLMDFAKIAILTNIIRIKMYIFQIKS